ncbi:MAG TPA: hypothetical protein VF278_22450 [Pirellulales bacterium]
MAPLNDPVRLRAYRNALANWRFKGFIRWTEQALRGLHQELEASTAAEVARLMHEYVCAGGNIDEVPETRAEWSHHDFHYDFRIEVEGKRLYIETRLYFDDPDDPDDPWIHVVNVHAP